MKMEHLKITREQEGVLINHMGSLEMLIRMHRNKEENTLLDDLTTDQLIDAYFGYYTIKETFNVRDYVTRIDNGQVIKVMGVNRSSKYVYENSSNIHYFKDIRHSTPEEVAREERRRWWKKRNRHVWELKEGDILKDIYQREIHEVVEIGFMGSVMFEGDTS